MSDANAPDLGMTIEEAAAKADRYAEVEGLKAAAANRRERAIARINANVDAVVLPLAEEQKALASALEAWWTGGGAALVIDGKKKSGSLGGCQMGTKAGKAKLVIDGEEAALVDKLAKRDWAKALVTTTVKLDKAALLKAVGGELQGQLKRLGVTSAAGGDVFFIKRTGQSGAMGG